jgi:hypothetical protein
MQDLPNLFRHQSRHHHHRLLSCTLNLPHACRICAMRLFQQHVCMRWPGYIRPPTAKHKIRTIQVARSCGSHYVQGACNAACQLHGVQSCLLTEQPQMLLMQFNQVSLPRRFAPESWPHPNAAVIVIVCGSINSGSSFRVTRCDCSR